MFSETFSVAERHHSAGEIESWIFMFVKSQTLYVEVTVECGLPNCTASGNKNLSKIIPGQRGCVYVVH